MSVKTSRVPLLATLAAVLGALTLLAVLNPLRQPEGADLGQRSESGARFVEAEASDRSEASANPSSASSTPPAGTLPGATRTDALPPVVDHGPRRGNKVALTFDADMTDAMRRQLRSGAVTSYANLKIIDRLEREGVPATFFLTGMWVEQYPKVTRRLAANPRFELANHTYGHLAFTADCYGLPRIDRRKMTADVARTFDLVSAYGGRQTRYFRFPGLCHDRAALTALAPSA